MNGGIDPKLERPGFETNHLGFHVCCVYCKGVLGSLLLLLTRGDSKDRDPRRRGGGLCGQRKKSDSKEFLHKDLECSSIAEGRE